MEMNKQFCYVKNVSQDEIDSKSYATESYMIEDLMLRTEIERFCNDAKISPSTSKPLIAKMICTAIEKGTFLPSKECKNNFEQLFTRIFSCFKD